MNDSRGSEAALAPPRLLGVRSVAANLINSTIGSGIFVLPAAVYTIAGHGSVWAYGACIIVVSLIALCYAELGGRVHAAGGTYAYVERAFGAYPGFMTNVLMWFGTHVVSSGAISAALCSALAVVFPATNSTTAHTVIVLSMFASLAFINVRGTLSGNRLVEGLTLVKMAALLLFVLAGVAHWKTGSMGTTPLPEPGTLIRASLLLFFAFTGVENAMTLSGEVRDPARTIPRGIALGLSTVALLYLGAQLACQSALGDGLGAVAGAPLAAAATRFAGPAAGVGISVAAALSMLGCLCGDVFSAPRMLYAMAQDGLAPRPLAAVHPRYLTPHVAIVVHATSCAVMSLTGSFEQLASLAATITLLAYLGCALATLRLRMRDKNPASPPFVIPGGPVLPLLACAATLLLLSSATRAEWTSVAVAAAVASLTFGAQRHLRTGAPTRG